MVELNLDDVPEREETACFTGHRPKRFNTYDEQDKLIIRTKDMLKEEIEKLYASGIRNFIAGGALGVDTWAEEAVLELRESHPVRLFVARPFRGQERIWPEHSRKRYHRILLHADGVYTIFDDDVYEPWKMLKRNEWMIDHSCHLVAVYDEISSKGGTYQAFNYAVKSSKVSVTIINPFKEVD